MEKGIEIAVLLVVMFAIVILVQGIEKREDRRVSTRRSMETFWDALTSEGRQGVLGTDVPFGSLSREEVQRLALWVAREENELPTRAISNCAGCEPLGLTFISVLKNHPWTEEQQQTIKKFFELVWAEMTGTGYEQVRDIMSKG